MPTIRRNIMEAVKSALKTIIENNDSGNGYRYHYTITDSNINDRPVSFENMAAFPAINIDFGDESCANDTTGNMLQTGGNRQLLHLSMECMFDCFLLSDNQSEAQDDMLADLQALFGNNYTIDGAVFNCIYSRSVPFGMQSNSPNCGISVVFKIYYRIYSSNPNVMA